MPGPMGISVDAAAPHAAMTAAKNARRMIRFIGGRVPGVASLYAQGSGVHLDYAVGLVPWNLFW
ncbi:hypothetical protein BMS3Bbin02_00260 [bacterium BMS3Bbin02]|nr:hypothetical protein BMS3Bbin02_00260 [bacterium BMS3Bbin02]